MVWLCTTKIRWKSDINTGSIHYVYTVYIKSYDIYRYIAEDIETRFDS